MSGAQTAIFKKVIYSPANFIRKNKDEKSIEVIGLDTEAYTTGQCFMICTSLGDTFHEYDYPAFLFTRKYRGRNYVCYNLKYDSGAFVQMLTIKQLKELQSEGETKYEKYTIKIIANKCLSIRKGKNTVHIYDMLNFYNMSLNKASKYFLGEQKIHIETYDFSVAYVAQNWQRLSEYCIHDAVLCKLLADLLIKHFEDFGVHPRKLYSVAYVSWQYFSTHCEYIHVKRYAKTFPKVLDYAMQAYNGGKFEVTEKGPGYYYEYDIVSAYPYEIANLVDIRDARVKYSNNYEKSALYGFINCTMVIPVDVFSPVAMKKKNVNFYPVGKFQKVITKTEYDYLIKYGSKIEIHDAVWLFKKGRFYPYRHEIEKLMILKHKYKASGEKMLYHIVKIFLNSFYGKMVQLIPDGENFKAGSSWNPIYGAIITANCRVRVSEFQQNHPSVVAVHTDSIISSERLDIELSDKLGGMAFEIEGNGVILGSGIYQVGKKSRFRGFNTKKPLFDLLPKKGKTMNIEKIRPITWREVAHRGMETDLINRFTSIPRKMRLNFDSKRIWLNDFKNYSEVFKRNVESVPWMLP